MDDLEQTHASPLLAASVSVSLCEPLLLDSVVHVLLVFYKFSDSYSLSSPFSMGYLIP